MIEIKVLTPAQLDFAEFVALQQAAFADLVKGTGTGYLFSEPYYRWKYSSPRGEARTALIYEQGELLAANSMYPMQALSADASVRAWQSCDSATRARARGRGYFVRCVKALREQVGPDEIFLGFPNKNSTPGFAKAGCAHHSDLNTFVRAWPAGRMRPDERIRPITSFGPEQDAFSASLAAAGGALLERSAAYMNWRYFQHPLHQYECFAWNEAGRQLGLLVMRRLEISGRVLAIALELLALERRVEGQLLSLAASWARTKGVRYTMVLNNTTGAASCLSHGYVPVPMWVLPKRQMLFGVANGPLAERIWRQDWHVQIGDWDVF